MRNLVQRSDIVFHANAQRVMSRVFIPGEEELIRGVSRARELVDRCLALPETTVESVLASTLERYQDRHRDLRQQFENHFSAVAGLVGDEAVLTEARRLLIGAYFTQEYAFEATAYFNPSIVEHPDQTHLPQDCLRFVMSIRAVGEGHISSVIFRTGVIGPEGMVQVDEASPYATTEAHRYTVLRSALVKQEVIDRGLETEELDLVLGMLPDPFTPEELDVGLSQLHSMRPPDPEFDKLTDGLHQVVRSSYAVEFDESLDLSERVLWPTAPNERRGMEDARWVRFVDGDSVLYRATYTGFDGASVSIRVLETTDFRVFSSMDLSGVAAANKGVAFFPRKVAGRYLALSRWDRESSSIAWSENGYHWEALSTIQEPARPWELVHVGNCGSPMETEEGWLVLTHGTGPMREYVMSALLLDLDDPSIVRGSLDSPLLTAESQERNGYVPNVVYSCGGIIHAGKLVLPYGFSDSGTRIAIVDLDELLHELLRTGSAQ